MREIKFRVLVEGEGKGADGWHYIDVSNGISEFESRILSEYKVMQYTGLKDKNGVEIYEGDIIMENVHYFVDNFKDASILGTDKNGKRTYERIEKKPMRIFLDAKKGWKLRSDTYNYESPFWAKDDVFFNKIEVIGNIYENPELITKR